MKFLIWLVVAWAVVVWMQRAKKNMVRRARDAAAQAAASAGADFGAAGQGGPSAAGMPPSSSSSAAIEQMVQCAQCGIHFPKSEAIQARGTGKIFCCIEHRELHVLDAGVH
ncbi:MAG TPA: PP0621 family protein [Herbaspirillum sp.]|jgi:uncharacterized protein